LPRSRHRISSTVSAPGIVFLLAVILSFLLPGCAGSSAGPAQTPSSPISAPASLSTTPSTPVAINPPLVSTVAPASSSATQTASGTPGGGLTVISSLRGKVTVLIPPATAWVPGKVGMALSKEYSLKTEAGSTATITFFEGSTIDIEESTEVKIVDLKVDSASGTTTTLLSQKVGQTISRINKLVDSSSRYEIETPAAVAAVRGTTMQVAVALDGSTTVANIEGSVSVIAQGQEVKLLPGQHSFVFPGQPPGPPQPGLTETPYDRQRASVITYLQIWNRTDTPITDAVGAILLPAELNDTTRAEISRDVATALAALQTGLPKVEALTAPDIDLVRAHLSTYKKLMEDEYANAQALQKALDDNSPAEYLQASDETNNINARSVDVYGQLTENLMAQFSILENDIPD
jgi:hypothetical protein